MNAKPNTYRVPLQLKLKAAGREAWPALLLLGPMPFIVPWAAFHNSWSHPGVLSLIAWTLFVAALGVYVFWWSSHKRSVRYEVDGITVIWAAREYYVPPEIFREFVRKNVWGRFASQTQDTRALTRGVVLVYEGAEPYVPVRKKDGKVGYKHVWGATWPWRALSRIAGHARLDDGVDGHELRLHCCHALHPGRIEAEDVAWMRQKGIIT